MVYYAIPFVEESSGWYLSAFSIWRISPRISALSNIQSDGFSIFKDYIAWKVNTVIPIDNCAACIKLYLIK